ncbi:hypothetical protein J6590_006898 [Homalodisca vitripennis]|nr:hypothetical protein J6590_006898 [Homalodisca vitripennis]
MPRHRPYKTWRRLLSTRVDTVTKSTNGDKAFCLVPTVERNIDLLSYGMRAFTKYKRTLVSTISDVASQTVGGIMLQSEDLCNAISAFVHGVQALSNPEKDSRPGFPQPVGGLVAIAVPCVEQGECGKGVNLPDDTGGWKKGQTTGYSSNSADHVCRASAMIAQAAV